jgi:hypothetical protein
MLDSIVGAASEIDQDTWRFISGGGVVAVVVVFFAWLRRQFSSGQTTWEVTAKSAQELVAERDALKEENSQLRGRIEELRDSKVRAETQEREWQERYIRRVEDDSDREA